MNLLLQQVLLLLGMPYWMMLKVASPKGPFLLLQGRLWCQRRCHRQSRLVGLLVPPPLGPIRVGPWGKEGASAVLCQGLVAKAAGMTHCVIVRMWQSGALTPLLQQQQQPQHSASRNPQQQQPRRL